VGGLKTAGEKLLQGGGTPAVKRYLYALPEEDFYRLLTKLGKGAEVLKREGETVYFYLYEPAEGLKPLKEEEVPPYEEKPDFGPVSAGPFVIVPPWKEVIKIKPGMAFGTGLHPTTRSCLLLLSKYLKGGEEVLDVGTGSGILALGALLLGAKRAVGIDVSEEAVRECKENAKLNRLPVECLKATPEEVKETFDLVVANLELPVFEKVLPSLLRLGKRFVLSGLYGKKEVEELRKLVGREEDDLVEEEGWYALYYKMD